MERSVLYVTFTSLPFGWVLAAFAIAAVMCFVASPFAERVARLIGAMDVPKDARRVHKKPIPRMGGLAIFIAFTTATMCFFPRLDSSYFGMLAGGAILIIGGIVDDKYNLRPLYKFSFQLAAAGTAVASGVRIDILNNIMVFSEEEYLSLGWLSIPITMGWIILLINAVNLIDGLDGLAAGISSISSITMLVIAVLLNDVNSAIITAALAGACIGFLPYNFNPARMFMGETGASFIGYTLATVSVMGLFKMYAVVSVAVPFLILGLPIFEIVFSAVRRIAKGQSPVTPDRKHLHHRLMDIGLSQKQSVAFMYTICICLGACAVSFVLDKVRLALLLISVTVIVGIVFALSALHAGPIVVYRKLKLWLISLRNPDAVAAETVGSNCICGEPEDTSDADTEDAAVSEETDASQEEAAAEENTADSAQATDASGDSKKE